MLLQLLPRTFYSYFWWISSVEHRICPRWTNSTLCFFFFFNVALKRNQSPVASSNLVQAFTSEVSASGQKKLRPTLFKCSRELVIKTDANRSSKGGGRLITLHTHTVLLPPSVFSNMLAHMDHWFSRTTPWVCVDISFTKWHLIS